MLRQVAPENISFNKKVLKVVDEDDKVTIHCSDNTAYECDIVVGADGAYSSVRQNMQKDMKEKGILPKSDGESLIAGYNCMVGVTQPLDPEKYPVLKDDNNCHFESIIGSERHTVCSVKVMVPFVVHDICEENGLTKMFLESLEGQSHKKCLS